MKNKNLQIKTGIIIVAALVLLGVIYGINYSNSSLDEAVEGTNIAVDRDLVIQLSKVSDTATYYPAEIQGTKLEVIAVKASDGSIRTAFNTCQVCYNSGRGYYVQEGNALICQNCGNRFRMDEVEVTKGGCNPVPITDEYKTVDSTKITISNEFLNEAKVIFENWKR